MTERGIKKKWRWEKAVAIVMALGILIGNISEAAALVPRTDSEQKTVLTYEERDGKTQVKEFFLTEQGEEQWTNSFQSFSNWATEEGYTQPEEAFEENGMVYINEENASAEIPLYSEAVSNAEEMPEAISLKTYTGDGEAYYIWRLCKAVLAEVEEEETKAEAEEDATVVDEADGEETSEPTEAKTEEEPTVVDEANGEEPQYQYFWVRTEDKIELEAYNNEDTQEQTEEKTEEAVENSEETAEEPEVEVVEEEKAAKNSRSTLASQRASADIVVTSWAQLKSAVESTPAYGSKTIGIGTSFSSTRDVIHFGANAGVNIKVVNMGSYVINCSTRADVDAVASEGGAIRVKNGAVVTFENLRFDGGMTSSIESAARSNSLALHNGTNLSGASTNFAFIGIQSGSLDIVGNQSAMYNFRLTYDNRACLIATGYFNDPYSAVLNIRQGRFYNNWGIDGSLVLTQGVRAVTNVYGGEYDHNFVRDEGLFDIYDLYHGATNFYGGTIHDNYGTAWDGTLSSTVAICDLRTAQGQAQGSVRLYFRGSANGNSGINVYNNYHLRNRSNGFVTLGSGQELASNMGLIWNWEATTGAKIKENSQHAVLFDMTHEDHLQIGPTVFIKSATGHYSPDGQISLAMAAGMSGAPYGYFSDRNSEDGIADGMYLDYDYPANSAIFSGKRYGLYEGDLPAGVSPMYYNGKTINKMLYLTDRIADVTYNLYAKSGDSVTQIGSLNGVSYPMTKRIGLPADYRVAITAPVDSTGRYVASEYKWGDEGSTNALTNGSTPKRALSSGQSYTINIYYKDSTVPDPVKYSITYNANGGSGAPDTQTFTHGQGVTLSSTQPTRSGYTFLGWSENPSGSVSYTAGQYLGAINRNMNLYAVWQQNVVPTYSITYNANGGSGAPSTQTFTQGQAVTLSVTRPTRSGYTFQGWSESASAQAASYTAGQYMGVLNRNMNLYAVWSQVATGEGTLKIKKVDAVSKTPLAGATFYVTSDSVSLPYNQTVTTNAFGLAEVTDGFMKNATGNLSIEERTAPTGYEKPAGKWTARVVNGTITSISYSDGSDTVYGTVTKGSDGYWVFQNKKPEAPKYTVTAEVSGGRGGSVAPATQTVTEGDSATVTFTANAGYQIEKVMDGSDDVTASVSGNRYTISNVRKDHHVVVTYAEIPAKTYTVTAEVSGGRGGSVAPATQTITEGDSAIVTFSPNAGYQIEKVMDGPDDVTTKVSGTTYTIDDVRADHHVVVTYSEIAKEEGEFKLKKVDSENGTTLAGAEFYCTSTSVTLPYNETIVTDANGLASITFPMSKAKGVMTIEERKAPDGYEKPSGKWSVTVENGSAVSVTYSDSADTTYAVTKGADGYWVFKNKGNAPKEEICPLTFDESTGKLTDKNGDEITQGITIENGMVTLTDAIFSSCVDADAHTDGEHYLIIKRYVPAKYGYTYEINLPCFREFQTITTRQKSAFRAGGPTPEGTDIIHEPGPGEIFNSPGMAVGVSEREVYLATAETGPRLIINEIREIRYMTEDAIWAGQSSDPDTPAIVDNTGNLKCLDLTFAGEPTTENTHLKISAGAEVPGGTSRIVTGYAGYNKRMQVMDRWIREGEEGRPVDGDNWLMGDITITNQDAANENRAYIRGTDTHDNTYSENNDFGITFPLKAASGDATMADGRNGKYKDVRFQNQAKLLKMSIPKGSLSFMVERQGAGRTDKGLTSREAEIENESMYCWDHYVPSDGSPAKSFGVQTSEVGVDYRGISLTETKHVGYKLKNYANVADEVMNTKVAGQPIVCLDAVAGSKRMPLDEDTTITTPEPWFTVPKATEEAGNASWEDAKIETPGKATIKLEVPGEYTSTKPYCQASEMLNAETNVALTASHTLQYRFTFKEPASLEP